MLQLTSDTYARLVGLALDEYPLEACGLLAGPLAAAGVPGNLARIFYPCKNDAASARIYTVNPLDFMRAEKDADDRHWEINGVVH
ncbi:MAG: Mov34/MPN/PAD-1 family protein, partial [Ilumatobacter sp.]|nr:Mov34/MPN/PAD-1 family protein [Ilumatobacter sp.]